MLKILAHSHGDGVPAEIYPPIGLSSDGTADCIGGMAGSSLVKRD